MGPLKLALLVVLATTLVYAQPADNQRKRKAIGIFNIVKFPNDVCATDSTATPSGTCFTAEECSDKSGVASGSCADGYGVCCIISLACGGTTSANCTYLTQAATTTPPTGGCSYTICPGDSTVNRIRLDLTMFSIAGPFLPGTTNTAATGSQSATGSCTTDALTVTGTRGPYPVICGVNTGQHMIVDTDGSTCVTATFSYGAGSASRSYSIHAIQYSSTNSMGGPPGCLQYFTGTTGTASSFNWQGVTTRTSSVHLQNQDYNICVRQERGSCHICWNPTTGGDANSISGTFGLSVSGAATAAKGVVGDTCSTDFVILEGAQTETQAKATATVTLGNDRICGRFFSSTTMATTDTTACSRATPFILGVATDGNENLSGAAQANADANELADGAAAMATAAFGTLGFQLSFYQGC